MKHNVAKTENFPTKIRNTTRISTLMTSIQHCTGGSTRSISGEKGSEEYP